MRIALNSLAMILAASMFAEATASTSRAHSTEPRSRTVGRVLIGSPDLLRNDETTTIAPLTPPKPSIFTAGCSVDPTISLDKGDPATCTLSIPGEGASTPTNGSDDDDDFYVQSFTAPGTSRLDADSNLLSDTSRPLIYYQIENACDDNGLLMVKDLGQDTVDIYLNNAVPCPTGACCDATNGCLDDQLEYECVAAGGVFRGDATTCATDPCTGACCSSTQACLDDQAEADCATLGGTYQGDLSTCVANPCTGACCDVAGGCTPETESVCLAAGGTYQGDTSSCGAGTCQDPTGACCTTTGCSILTAVDCQTAAGVYRGDATTCATAPCTGACCDPALGCVPNQTASACQNVGGTYQGNNSICSAGSCVGACCDPVAGCVDGQTPTACQTAGGSYHAGSLCSSSPCVGACCSATQPCRDGQSSTACQASGGSYRGDGSTCVANPCVGACCDVVRGCTEAETAVACQAANGSYQGDTSTCAANPCPGACCSAAQGCVNGQTPSACQAVSGIFLGPATDCATSQCGGACCDPVRGCTDAETSASCVAAGGTYQGDLSSCANLTCTGACCTASFGCSNITPAACNQIPGGSAYQGDGTQCATVSCPGTGACCEVFGCTQKYEPNCTGYFAGVGVSCAGLDCDDFDIAACCDDAASTCNEITRLECQNLGLRFIDGDLCSPNTCDIGACCTSSFGCRDNQTPEMCRDIPGQTVFVGDGTSCAVDGCPPTGACCGVFNCSVTYEDACTGPYAGDGSTCSPDPCAGLEVGACCDDGASTCSDLTFDECTANGDRFVSGDLCSPDTCDIGACCSANFSCMDNWSPEQCADRPGADVHLGDGTVCGPGGSNCPPTGACCGTFGCSNQFSTTCNGTYLGDGTTCGAGVCFVSP